ncbi:MAG: FAD-dependent oxidoreductase [Pseudomonadales bacterium]
MRAELAIVGAGPAGMAAAQVAARYGIDVVVIDEQGQPGGQILRQPPAQFRVRQWLTDRVYRSTQKLLQTSTAQTGIRWIHQSSVIGIFNHNQEHELHLNGPDGVTSLVASRVLIAAGCYDMPVSFPGSTLPGVMATGGIQAFVKSQRIIPGERFVFAGSHPLQLIVADQVTQAGGTVEAVVFSQPLKTVLGLIPYTGALLRHPAKLIYIAGAYLRLLRNGVKITTSSTLSRAIGNNSLESVQIVPVSGKDADKDGKEIACDRLGLCFSFLASTDLARQAGAQCAWSEKGGGWLAEHDEWMRSSVPGIYVAGEVTGVAGADVAELEGLIAGYAAALDEERIDLATAQQQLAGQRRKLKHAQNFADALSALSYPGIELLRDLMNDDSVICKCEELSVGKLKQTLRDNPLIRDVNAIKLLSRCGMGLCQGRYCSFQLSTLLASDYDIAAETGGTYKARFPTKPVTIESLLHNTAESKQS